jgi:hypothetical protein
LSYFSFNLILNIKMEIKCACLNNTPVRIQNDNKQGERYECYYCKFRWRYIDVYSNVCDTCNESSVNAVHTILNYKTYIKCNYCGKLYLESKHTTTRILVLW